MHFQFKFFCLVISNWSRDLFRLNFYLLLIKFLLQQNDSSKIWSSTDFITAIFNLPSNFRWRVFSASSNWRPVDSSSARSISLPSQRWRWFVDWRHSYRGFSQFLSILMLISTMGSKRRWRGFWGCWEKWLTWSRFQRFHCACYCVGCWVNLRSIRTILTFF